MVPIPMNALVKEFQNILICNYLLIMTVSSGHITYITIHALQVHPWRFVLCVNNGHR